MERMRAQVERFGARVRWDDAVSLDPTGPIAAVRPRAPIAGAIECVLTGAAEESR